MGPGGGVGKTGQLRFCPQTPPVYSHLPSPISFPDSSASVLAVVPGVESLRAGWASQHPTVRGMAAGRGAYRVCSIQELHVLGGKQDVDTKILRA